jgi:hypothetical protein
MLSLIREHIHSDRDRLILRDRLIHGMTLEKLSEKHDLSVRQIKNIIYKNERILFSKLP